MAQSYIDLAGIKFTRAELLSFLQACSSIDRKGIVRSEAILGHNGKPIPSDEYQKLIGAWKLREIPNFSKTYTQTQQLKNHKNDYKAGMRVLFGSNWKKISRKLGYNNVPSNKEDYNRVAQEVANLNS